MSGIAKKEDDNNEETSTRDVLSQAFDDSLNEEEDQGSEEDEDLNEDEEDQESDGEEEDEEQDDDESRDEEPEGDDSGEEEEDEDEDEESGGEEEDHGTGDQDAGDSPRAPVNWDPATREHWAGLPPEVQAQVLKREQEITETLGRTTKAREFAEQWQGLVQPYTGLMAAQNATPYQAVDRLLQIGAGLAMGNPTQKADIIKNLINQYQVDLPTLDNMLADPNAVPPVDVAGEVSRQMQMMQQQQRNTQQQAEAQQFKTEMEQFAADPNNEFFEDVRNDMADLMDMAASRGQQLTLADAYTKACGLNDQVSKVLAQRAAAEAARKNKKEVKKKKKAASSIKGKRSGSGERDPNAPQTMADSVANAWEMAEKRQRQRI